MKVFNFQTRVRFLEKTENGFVISDHMDSPPPKKTEDPKRIFAMTTRSVTRQNTSHYSMT